MEKGRPVAAVVAWHIDRIIDDLDAGRDSYVIPQLDADLWKDMLKRLGVSAKFAGHTLRTLREARTAFDPEDSSSRSAAREPLSELLELWSDLRPGQPGRPQ